MTRKSLRTFIIITDCVYGVSFLLSIIRAFFSIMLAGGSSPRIYIQVFNLATFPFVLLFAIIVPWIIYRAETERAARTLLLLPLANVFFILFYLVIPGLQA